MSYQKIYSREYWENFPSEKTAINQNRLNNIEGGIDELDNRVCALDTTKVDLTKANDLVKEILWDESNGTLTVVKMNGSKAVIDTKLEKLAVNFKYNPQTQQLVITLDDGTVQNVDLSSLITEYEFLESDTIAFEITDGKVKAIVKNGSITEDHISPDYLGEIRTQVGKAEMSAKSADASEKSAVSSSALAKSYAVGGTGTRDGEDTDNAKYYAEQAKNASDVGALAEKLEQHTSNRTIHVTNSEKDIVSKLGESTEGTLTFNGKDVIGSAVTVDDALSSKSTNPVQNKVVTNEFNHQSTEMMDIKMLGWAVPRECPIQNEVNGNQFIQKVGRVDLGSLNWSLRADGSFENELFTSLSAGTIPDESKEYAIYSNLYKSSSWDSVVNSNAQDMVITLYKFYAWPYASIAIRNKKYTDVDSFKQAMQGQYLYYEVATPITKTIDGNEIGETVSDVRKETTVNLLNSTFDTDTRNGITFTRNDDGTYSLSGSRTDTSIGAYTTFIKNFPLEKGKYKLTGAVDENNYIRCIIKEPASENRNIFDYGDGVVLDVNETDTTIILLIVSTDDTSKTRIIKPMLTTNLSAAYDDFVPYTGGTGRLNGDVAELKAQSVKKDNVTENVKIDGKTIFLNSNGELSAKSDESALKIVTFANGTNEEIANMIQAHYDDKINIADYWAVGDTRTVSLSAMAATGVGESHRAQSVKFVIGGFNHDDLTSPINGHTKAAITLLQKDCLMDATSEHNSTNGSNDKELGYMNSSKTNAGGWKNCARRTWCNHVYFKALPTTWQSMIKTVNKKTSVGNGSSTIETVQDKIFLAAEIEIFGSTTYSATGEGTQYQYYKNATANRYKLPKWSSSSASHIYLERSPFSGNTAGFCSEDSNGHANGDNASSAYALAPCTCI